MKPPVVSIIAKSGTGKTTLLEKLIAEMKKRDYTIGVIKHDAHRFDIDHQGKDSWRLTQAGADTMLISSPEKLAIVKKHPPQCEPSLAEMVHNYFQNVDLVLTEGFKQNPMPKIEVHRRAKSQELLSRSQERDETLIAVATDSVLEVDVPQYDINDAAGLCDLIIRRYLS